ncbi:MAG: hypothetical protein ACD_62C00244G0015 [uncultured bacterium]|nr:MAG: hypothetical protein ACD_62C00244G0015 [uncultured bacterium]
MSAQSRTRTGTRLPSVDFESTASANSAIWALSAPGCRCKGGQRFGEGAYLIKCIISQMNFENLEKPLPTSMVLYRALRHMKKFLISAAVLSLFLSPFVLVSCAKDNSFSLTKLNQEQDISVCQTLLKKKKYKQALSCFESVKSRHYGQDKGAVADLAIADTYFKKKEYLVAADAYRLFIEANPFHAKVPYAYYKEGLSYLKETPKAIDRDQTHLDQAISALQTVVRHYAQTPYAKIAQPYLADARLKQARKHYYIGQFYYKNREYLAAIPRFQTIITDYPKLGLDEKSFYYLIGSLKKTGQKELALKFGEIFNQHYPDSPLAKKLKAD